MTTRFSVITVCYNAAHCLERTMASLFAQTWPHVEYIVVDGNSTDGTQAVVQRHAPRIDKFVSEPDKGIFDAMNKAIGLSGGDVLFFLNADDAFCDPQVLADVAACFEADPALDLVYGNVVHVNGAQQRRRRFHWVNARNIYFGDLCHQVVFARRALFQRVGGFDLAYPVNADYDWLLRAFSGGARTRYLNRDIAYFADGGFHTQQGLAHERERFAIKTKYRPAWQVRLGYWCLRLELKLRKLQGQAIS